MSILRAIATVAAVGAVGYAVYAVAKRAGNTRTQIQQTPMGNYRNFLLLDATGRTLLHTRHGRSEDADSVLGRLLLDADIRHEGSMVAAEILSTAEESTTYFIVQPNRESDTRIIVEIPTAYLTGMVDSLGLNGTSDERVLRIASAVVTEMFNGAANAGTAGGRLDFTNPDLLIDELKMAVCALKI